MRLLILKLTAMLAAHIVCASGCAFPFEPMPKREPANTTPQQVQLTIKVEDGKIAINDATIKVQQSEVKTGPVPSPSPTGCDCGCKLGTACQCPRCRNTARSATTDKPAKAEPQFVLQPETRMVYQCRNGQCGWYPVTTNVRVPVKNTGASTEKRIKIYIQPNYLATRNASIVMRRATGECDGIGWYEGNPPPIDGKIWWPTVVKADGSTWTPGAAGWTDKSLAEFTEWLK